MFNFDCLILTDVTKVKMLDYRDVQDKYDAIVHVDDSHATGFVGPAGKGSGDYHDVLDKIDIITSTFGKISHLFYKFYN